MSTYSAVLDLSVTARGTLQVTVDWAKYLAKRLVEASWQGVEAVKDVLPADTAVKLLEAASVHLRHEPTVVDVSSIRPPQHDA